MSTFRDFHGYKYKISGSSPKHTSSNKTKCPNENGKQIRVGSKVVGEVIGHEFVKYLRGNHFLYRPPAIALDCGSLKEAELAGANIVRIIDQESGKVYRALISTIHNKGFPVNRGYGEQIGLLLPLWSGEDECLGEQLCFWREK
jgi:hypothetical protein